MKIIARSYLDLCCDVFGFTLKTFFLGQVTVLGLVLGLAALFPRVSSRRYICIYLTLIHVARWQRTELGHSTQSVTYLQVQQSVV